MPPRWMPDCRPRLGARPHVRKRLILARRALIIAAMTHAGNPPLDDARYLALQARDARFDGCFVTGVTSTGIYCRPVCRVRIPKRENCRFFAYAAQAEQAGLRPCLRCRPELAPRAPALGQAPDTRPWSIQDASSILARQALRLLGTPEAWDRCVPTVRQLALRLGVSDRHLRRIFDSAFGVSPLHYLQTQRLLNAKQLLTDTRLGVTQVAHLSGFASLRRFNAAFVQHYALNPTRLRREDACVKTGIRKAANPGIHLRLAYRPPYDAPAMLHFLAMRQISGIEEITPTLARRAGPASDRGSCAHARGPAGAATGGTDRHLDLRVEPAVLDACRTGGGQWRHAGPARHCQTTPGGDPGPRQRRRQRVSATAQRSRRTGHARCAAGHARHWRLDRAVHRDAGAALARRVSGR